ncbi:hypothetical protein CLLU_32860 [Clostridium luticellarii]|jgi:hypothetical protein|uniref:Uncharacterized protein n=1 Tax=Clostridium luticellarii TaxID=1691940 RepID=A0A2T0BAD9_9CLOT|nr:hypothetical protein CLLU_32860 [Clostridium luticellarii]
MVNPSTSIWRARECIKLSNTSNCDRLLILKICYKLKIVLKVSVILSRRFLKLYLNSMIL